MKHKGFITGLVLGATLFGATPAIASGIIAELSSQPIYVDGVLTPMTAYSINGNNYIKLRDVGQAVDFGVTYDTSTNSVYIDSDSPYITDDIVAETVSVPQTVEEMVTQTYLSSNALRDAYQITVKNQTITGVLSNGQDPTEENIQAMLDEVAALYPQDTSWGATYNDGDLYWYEGSTACNSYAYMVRDILYGTDCVPTNTHNDLSQAQVGDIVYLRNDATAQGHWVVISGLSTDSAGDIYFETMSGNVNSAVSIDARYYLETNITRYPDSTVYCFH